MVLAVPVVVMELKMTAFKKSVNRLGGIFDLPVFTFVIFAKSEWKDRQKNEGIHNKINEIVILGQALSVVSSKQSAIQEAKALGNP